MITEQPVIQLVNFELYIPNGGFILNRSRLDVDNLGNGANMAWTRYIEKGTSITAQRGGKRSGLGIKIAVGTLTIVLRDTALATDVNLVPNTRIRFSNAASTQPFFTGTITDVDYKYELAPNGDKTKLTTLVVTDSVQDHANTNRYGAVSATGAESWEDRIKRLVMSSTVPTNVPVTPAPVLKYQLTDIATMDGWSAYGPNPSTLGAVVNRTEVSPDIFGAPTYSLMRYTVPTVSQTIPADVVGMQRTLTGLTVGRIYSVEAVAGYFGAENPLAPHVANKYRVAVLGRGVGSAPWGFTERFASYPLPTFRFVATANSHTLLVLLAEEVPALAGTETEAIGITQLRVYESQSLSTYLMSDTVYEASLASHFDLACASANAYWWVDRAGVTQFSSSLAAGAAVATFTDVRTPGRLEYGGIDASFDTRAVVNDINVTQHGTQLNEDGATVALDVTLNYKDTTSVASWGPRSDDIDVAIFDDGEYAGSLDRRMTELLAAAADPVHTVTRIRWNAQENPGIVPSLDVYAPIDVIFNGVTQQSRIVNIKHNLTPTRWMITLELIRR